MMMNKNELLIHTKLAYTLIALARNREAPDICSKCTSALLYTKSENTQTD